MQRLSLHFPMPGPVHTSIHFRVLAGSLVCVYHGNTCRHHYLILAALGGGSGCGLKKLEDDDSGSDMCVMFVFQTSNGISNAQLFCCLWTKQELPVCQWLWELATSSSLGTSFCMWGSAVHGSSTFSGVGCDCFHSCCHPMSILLY